MKKDLYTPEQVAKALFSLERRISCLACDISAIDSVVNFSVNADPNTGGTTFSPNTPNLTTVIYISTIDSSQWTFNGVTYVTYIAPFWNQTGNSGTVDGINFIGTTDNIPFNIRVNNQKAGKIDHLLFNTSFGYLTSNSNTTGSWNTAIGIHSLYHNLGGNFNTANGGNALYYNNTGTNNTANGYEALYSNTTGSYNTAIGYEADVSAVDLTNATAIGSEAIVNLSNQVVLGNDSVTSTLLKGIVTTNNSIELGHATDTTISRVSAGVIAVEGSIVDTAMTTTEVSNATPTPAITSTRHTHTITALAAAAVFGIPTSSIAFTDNNTLIYRIKDDATARALSFNAIYRFSSDLVAPTTTISSTTLYIGFKYNVADTKWDCLSILNNI